MNTPTIGEIAILVDQIAAVEAALAAATAELGAVRQSAREAEHLLAAELGRLAERAIAEARPDPAASADKPTVSVILPVLNRCGPVGDAIRSVLAQSFAGWELIVVDDGSTDALESAVAPFLADPRIRFVRQAHAGMSAARNRALAMARGELVAYIDSDNYWFPGFLAAATALFAAEPDAELGYAALLSEHEGRTWIVSRPFDRERLLERNVIDINVIVHRRHLCDRFGTFDEFLARAVDLDLLLRYTAHRRAVRIPTLGARYRNLGGPRVSTDVALAPNLFHIRRKWRKPPERRPRILYVAEQFPQLSETHIHDESNCMQRFGAEVEVWAPAAGIASTPPGARVHRGSLAAAIRAMRPDVVHVHWLTVLERQRAEIEEAGVPVTARAHSFDSAPSSVLRALSLALLKRLYLLPAAASYELPVDDRLQVVAPTFDTALFKPAGRKDRRLVLRAVPGLPQNDPFFICDLAKRLPGHRVVLAVSRASGFEFIIDEIRAYKAKTGSPAELLVDVPRAEMAALFAAAGIYVHTFPGPDAPLRKRLGGPVSIAEAMATGAYVLVRDVPGLLDYVGDAGDAYRDVDSAAGLIRATEDWPEARWQAAQRRSVERAFTHHADETALAPIFDDWCAIAREREMRDAQPAAAS